MTADRIECQTLRGEFVGRSEDNGLLHKTGVRQRPLQRLLPAKRAADHRIQMRDSQLFQQPLLNTHPVSDSNDGKLQPIRPPCFGVDGCRPRRSVTAAQNVGTDDKPTVCVDALPRADDVIPPAGAVLAPRPVIPLPMGVPTGGVGISAQRMADKNAIVAVGGRRPVGFVFDFNIRQNGARFGQKRTGGVGNNAVFGRRPADRPRGIGQIVSG